MYMEYQELIEKRYSVRNYQDKAVEEDKLQKVLEAARLAPTAANKQPFKLIVVKTQGKKKDLRRIYHAEWFSEAPLVICACAIPSKGWTRRDGRCYVEVDVAIAMDHLILAAADSGLGTCWIAAFDSQAAKEVLKLPEGVEPLLFTPLGYPADSPQPKSRKGLKELVCYEHW